MLVLCCQCEAALCAMLLVHATAIHHSVSPLAQHRLQVMILGLAAVGCCDRLGAGQLLFVVWHCVHDSHARVHPVCGSSSACHPWPKEARTIGCIDHWHHIAWGYSVAITKIYLNWASLRPFGLVIMRQILTCVSKTCIINVHACDAVRIAFSGHTCRLHAASRRLPAVLVSHLINSGILKPIVASGVESCKWRQYEVLGSFNNAISSFNDILDTLAHFCLLRCCRQKGSWMTCP